MVSTRSHPSRFPPPDLSASKSLTKAPQRSTRSQGPDDWTHTPNALTVAWLILSLPLVIWDMIYVFFRPHTMPGGWMNSPIYTPYDLYGTIDYIYGAKAWEEGNGFTAAQSALNLAETVGYLGYLWALWRHGEGEGFGRRALSGGWGGIACLCGFGLAVMTVSKTMLYGECLTPFVVSTFCMFSWLDDFECAGLNEAFSGFENIGHNDWSTLVFLWILPK